MEEWDRLPGEKASSWSARLQLIHLPPTATAIERARLAALRRSARQAVRRALASERLRAVFHAETNTRPTAASDSRLRPE
jgi:hypothetical protein